MSVLEQPRKFSKIFGLRPSLLLVPVVLSLVSAVFEGLGTGLLVPVVKGLIQSDFSFLHDNVAGRTLLAIIPARFHSDHLQLFASLVGLVFVAGFCRIALGYFADMSYTQRLRYIAHQVRTELFSRTLGYGKLFFDRHKQGELHNVILGFTRNIMTELQGLHAQLRSVFMLLAYLTLMLLISWELTLVVCALFPLYHFSISFLLKRIGEDSQEFAEADSAVSNSFFNIISCVSLVKAAGREKQEAKRFFNFSKQATDIHYRIDSRSMLVFPVQEVITLLMAVFLVCCIAFIVTTNPARDVSSLLVYIFLLKRSASAFSGFGDMRGRFAALRGLFVEVNKLADASDKHIVPSGQKSFSGLRSEIEFRDLSFSYAADVSILEDVSFSIEQGGVTAIVGPSGSGKTTLIQLLLRFYDCPEEAILIDGVDVRDFEIGSLRSRMALVSQESQLFHDTLRENITYGIERDVSDEEIQGVLQRARLEDYVSSLPDGLETLIGDRGVQLSGGEKQRVSIARAMLREPEILILDEATSALDATTERLVQSAIDELIDGRTVVVIAHRFSTLKNADKIVTLEGGRIIESGSLSELLDSGGKFSTLWKDQELFH